MARSGHLPSSDDPLRAPTLDGATIEALAQRVAELLRSQDTPLANRRRLVDAATLAAELGVDRSWVYAHRSELGAVPLGAGPKPRLRFDKEKALEVLARQQAAKPQTQATNGRTRRRRRAGSTPELLPIRGSAAIMDGRAR